MLMAKMLLKNAGVEYVVIDATVDQDRCKALGVKNAPTLLVKGGIKLENVSDIKKYLEGLK